MNARVQYEQEQARNKAVQDARKQGQKDFYKKYAQCPDYSSIQECEAWHEGLACEPINRATRWIVAGGLVLMVIMMLMPAQG